MDLPPGTSGYRPERSKHRKTRRVRPLSKSPNSSYNSDGSTEHSRRRKRTRREHRSRNVSSSSPSNHSSTGHHGEQKRLCEPAFAPRQVLELASIVKDLATVAKNTVSQIPPPSLQHAVSAHAFRGDAIPIFSAEEPNQRIDRWIGQIDELRQALLEYLRTCKEHQPTKTWNTQRRDHKWKYFSSSKPYQKDRPGKEKTPIRCYRCNAIGHVASRCNASVPRFNQTTRNDDKRSKEGETTLVETLGSTTFTLKVDEAQADVKADVVPDNAQTIPILIGQPFTESPLIVVFKDNKNLRMRNVLSEAKEPQKSSDIATLWVKEATVIPPNYLGHVAVECKSAKDFAGDIFIE
ncbi:hypothetical protein CBL_20102, partial [Carabus blaptoides fortunei]